MNYSGEDCMNHFTPDQLNIMLSLLNGPRAILVSPGNLNRWGNTCVNGSAFFGYDKSFLCSADTVHFTAYQQTGAQYKWNVYSDSVTYNGTFGSNYTFSYVLTKQTSYTITLTVIFGTDTIMFTDSNAVTLAGCGTPITSEQGNWYFGEYGGLKFNTVMPVFDPEPYFNRIPLNINTEEGTISQSNAQGQLLFYGGGEPEYFTIGTYQVPLSGIFRVYDRNYTEMANSPIIGDHSSVQAGIVLPHPTQGHKYYIFTVTGGEGDKTIVSAPDHRGFRYSIIDTVLNDIDTNFKNVPIVVPISGHEHSGFDSALVSGEMITAIPKCNGTDYWIFVKGGFNSGIRYDRLLIFSLDSGGVSFHSYKDSVFDGPLAQQMLIASSNGMFVATSTRILDFDKNTGIITRSRVKPYSLQYGMNFSPNSRYFYQFESTSTKLYQYDLLSNNLTDSKQEIYQYGFSTIKHIQPGPDNNLYISNYSLDFLSVINFPDSGCNASEKNKCGFVYKGPSLGKNGIGGVCKNGLPNLVNAKKQQEIPLDIFTIDSVCNTVKFYSTACCENSYLWNFGDGDTSSQKNPIHSYTSTGLYTVTLYTPSDTTTKTITIGIETPVISGDTLAKCDTIKTHLFSCSNQNNYYSYEWSVNNGNLITVNYLNIAEVRLTVNGSIKLIAHNKATGCKDSSVVQISVLPILYNSIDTPVAGCQNDTPDIIIGFTPTGGYGSGSYTYKWYVSTDTGMVKTWSVISGATDSSYQPGVNTAQRWFKRVVTSGTCEIESNVSYTSFIQYNNTIARDTSDCDDIIGSTPFSYISYSWQRSIDSTNWTNIPSQTGKDLTAPVYFRTTYVRRVVQDSLCTSYSNVLTMQPSITTTVTATEDTICPGNELDVNGSRPCSENSTITHLWQFMPPQDNEFTDLGGYGMYTDLYHSNWSTECYLRRRSISGGDTLYSDTVYIVARDIIDIIYPLGSIPYLYEFCSGVSLPEMDGSGPCNPGMNFSFQWQSCTDTTNNSWSNVSADGVSSNYSSPDLYQTTFFRRRTHNNVSHEITYTPIFTMLMREPQITQQPTGVTVNEGNNAQFTVAFTDMQVVKWQQSYVSFGVTFLSDIADSDNDTLVVKADHCRHGKKYVAILQNLCTLGQLYSDTATLSVTAYNYDLWSKDNDLDNRSEPSGGFIWNSPDIWNRRSNDAGTVHQNAEHRVSAPNYVYVKVRNIGGSGQHASVPSKVYLYWTFANTGEKWTKHWVHDFDADSITGNWRTYQGVKHALGSLIAILDLSALNAGAETTMYVPWYPPNPGVINNGTDTVNADVCFLSRIVTCEEAPYGMVIHPEVADVGFNVRYNNNIITKNFVVYDTLAGNGKTRWGGNGNPADDARIGRLVFTADNCDYFDYGTVLLHLDAGMQEAWYANGANGSGFTVLNDSTLQMNDCVAVLDEILYSANQQAWLGVQFDESVGVPILEEINEFFTFNLQQYFDVEDEDTSVGGIVYAVPVVLSPPEISGSQRRNTPVQDTKANQLTFSAFPNPFNERLKVVYSLPKDENVTITLTNLLGQTIQTVEQNEFKTAGIHRLDINTTNLTEGIYFITFKAGNEIKQKKIVLIR
jgi:PKD repeat protein